MTERNKYILLGVLFAMFGIVIVVQVVLGPKRGRKRLVEHSDEALVLAQVPLPDDNRLACLAAWLSASAHPPLETRGRFGVPQPREGIPFVPGSGLGIIQAPGREPPAPPPVLDAVIWIDGEHSVVIGGEIYRAGQAVGATGYRIGKVTLNTVEVIDNQGKSHVLELP